jgi:hypothetical protein
MGISCQTSSMATVLSGRGRERTYSGIPSHTGRPRHQWPDLGGGWTGRGVGFGDESQSKRSLASSSQGSMSRTSAGQLGLMFPATPLPAYRVTRSCTSRACGAVLFNACVTENDSLIGSFGKANGKSPQQQKSFSWRSSQKPNPTL